MARMRGLHSTPTEASPDKRPEAVGERSYAVRAVARVCDVLDLLQNATAGVTLAQVAEATELPKASAFRYLWTLERRRYIDRDSEDGTYRLGAGMLSLASQQIDALTQRARPLLEELREEFDETVNLGILDGRQIAYLEILESSRSVRLAARVGDREPVHSTALGKAICAQLDENQVRQILDHFGMPKRTKRTITSVDRYLSELARVRRVGHAVDNCENAIDGRCVAVAVAGTPVRAAVSLSAPSARLAISRVGAVAQRLEATAEKLAVQLKSS